MKVALLQLGYGNLYHMSSTIENPPDCDMWLEAIDAKFYGKGENFGREQWDQLLGHVTVSQPTLRFCLANVKASVRSLSCMDTQ